MKYDLIEIILVMEPHADGTFYRCLEAFDSQAGFDHVGDTDDYKEVNSH